jgi:hypothetical protein
MKHFSYSVRDLWESRSFCEMELPRGQPMNPVLSMNEDEIMYISLSDIEFIDTTDSFRQFIGKQLVLNGHYVLRLDLLQNKVLYSKKSATNSLSLLRPIAATSAHTYPTRIFHFNCSVIVLI